MLRFIDESALAEANVTRDDIDGYDLGLIHSQRADFDVFYLTLVQAWTSSSYNSEMVDSPDDV